HHAWKAHGLELQPGLDAVGVGQQDLVGAEPDLFAGHGLAGDQVALDQLAGEALAHDAILRRSPRRCAPRLRGRLAVAAASNEGVDARIELREPHFPKPVSLAKEPHHLHRVCSSPYRLASCLKMST